jgi:hypothetical protein
MIAIILSAASIAACIKWGAWKRWREFYPTILYLIIGNLTYSFVFTGYWLWSYHNFLGHIITGLINKFLIYPPVVILFLTHYPAGKWKQAGYILAWAAGGTLIEAVSFLIGDINYHHGWNLFFSFLLFFGAFIFIRLHNKKPFIVWPVSLLCGIATALIFGLPPLE